MLFNSYVFILLFLPVVLVGWFGMNHFGKYTAAKVFLILASLVFYGYFNLNYLAVIITSVFINYVFGRLLLGEHMSGAR